MSLPRPLRRALAALLALVAAEQLLGWHYYRQTYRYYEAGEVYWEDSQTLLLFSPDRYLFWRLKPRIRMNLAETPLQYGLHILEPRRVPYAFTVQTNGRGLNSPEFACEKPAGVFRIATLGDSRTMAEGVPFESLYARRLERMLSASGGGERRFEVINAGVSGYSSYQGVVQLEREILPCRPDAATFLFGINDLDQEQEWSDREKAFLFDSPWLTLRQWLNRSMTVYFLRRQAWRARGFFFGKTKVAGRDVERPGAPARVSPEEYEQNLKRAAALASASRCRLLFVVVPTSPYAFDPSLVEDDRPGRSEAWHQLARRHQAQGRFDAAQEAFLEAHAHNVFGRYEDVVRRVAAATGTTLVDLSDEFLAARSEPLYLDDMHPNERGHQRIAEALARALAE
jgi:lysophospholipase L1-like esterase